MKVIAVMPAYNNEKHIGASIIGARKFVDEVVVVNDGSRDATARAARESGARVIEHCLNRGQGAALKTGNAAALRLGADVIIHIDADGQHDPASIPTLIAPLLEKRADVVFGSRFLGVKSEGMPLSRLILLQGARRFNMFALGISLNISDPQSGYRAMTSSAVKRVKFYQDRMAHCSELMRAVVKSDLRFQEVPVRVTYSEESLAQGQKATDALKIVWQLILGEMNR